MELRVPEAFVQSLRDLGAALTKGASPRFLSDEAALSVMRDCLVAQLRPEAVLLIGSRAGGTAGSDSDFDFVVVHRGREGDLTHEAAARPLLGFGLATDVVPVAVDDFPRERESPSSLVWKGKPTRWLYVRKGSPLDVPRGQD